MIFKISSRMQVLNYPPTFEYTVFETRWINRDWFIEVDLNSFDEVKAANRYAKIS